MNSTDLHLCGTCIYLATRPATRRGMNLHVRLKILPCTGNSLRVAGTVKSRRANATVFIYLLRLRTEVGSTPRRRRKTRYFTSVSHNATSPRIVHESISDFERYSDPHRCKFRSVVFSSRCTRLPRINASRSERSFRIRSSSNTLSTSFSNSEEIVGHRLPSISRPKPIYHCII